jgi:hypothetical protein
MASSFALMDTDNLSMVGSYPTRAAALRVVAEAARRYGETSEEARSLVLFRQDGPADRAHIAKGDELVHLALAAPRSTLERMVGTVRKLRSSSVTGPHRPGGVTRGLPMAARSKSSGKSPKSTTSSTSKASAAGRHSVQVGPDVQGVVAGDNSRVSVKFSDTSGKNQKPSSGSDTSGKRRRP